MKFEDYTHRHKVRNFDDTEFTHTLEVESPNISPGKNTFILPWTVMTVGQYVVTSIEIKWKNALFMQDYCIPRHPVHCFDVLPNEPTQSIELNPIFLVSLYSTQFTCYCCDQFSHIL